MKEHKNKTMWDIETKSRRRSLEKKMDDVIWNSYNIVKFNIYQINIYDMK